MKKHVFYLSGYLLFALFFAIFQGCDQTKTYEVNSPDGSISCIMWVNPGSSGDEMVSYSVTAGGKEVILPSSFLLTTADVQFDGHFTVESIERETVDREWENHFGELKTVPERFEQLKLFLVNEDIKLNFICRVYNEGVAFAYEIPDTGSRDSVTITDEHFSFRFKDDYSCWATYRAQAVYEKIPLSQIKSGCERPLVVECDTNLTVALAEAQLVDFARMKFGPDTTETHAVRTVLHGETVKKVPFQSPWRVVMIAESPGQLLEQNYLVQNLNPPSEIADHSWIEPGKVIREVTLTTVGGIACIDFAASHRMQYVLFDAGWYGPENDMVSDATTITLDEKRSKGPLDLQWIIQYGKEKGIGVILYVNRRALEQQLDTLLPLYQSWGVAGIKYGFVQVGDQEYTRWLHEAVKKTAEYKMVVDIHDEYRPTGFSRTYPNLLTQEGIRGDEESIPNSHTLITMFTRMLVGAGDNTICYYSSRVTEKMGSHASQLAKAVCLFSPLQFLYWYDRPEQAPDKKDGLWGKTGVIGDEPELEFFNNVPTVWDETRVLIGEIGKCGIIARRSGAKWFIGGINGDEATDVEFEMDFLDAGRTYDAKIYTDDPEIETRTNVRIEIREVNKESLFEKSLMANNGFAIQLTPVE
ncbi:glycoside hydrolase family 97 protein [Gaoshiqia sp. Z1-71]|uniref:glycoside hydrolase family 97 protein n=1 Tax=Gaoshiqia hydrogeniformans TaxID=3290090 RepID=UPI003BF8706A